MKIRYFSNLGFIFKGLLGYVAYVCLFPTWLSPWINKLRGVKIGDVRRVYIAPNVLLDSLYPELITIEDDVYITRGVKVLCHTNFTPPQRKHLNREVALGAVVIEEGAFIGCNAIILPGVRIGRCALVGAGAVVTRDVPPFAVVGGNPAKVVGTLDNVAR